MAYSIKGIDRKNNLTKLLLIPPIGPKLKIIRFFPFASENVDKMAFKEYVDKKYSLES